MIYPLGLLVQNFVLAEVHADHFFRIGRQADDEVHAVHFRDPVQSLKELREVTQGEIAEFQDAVDIDGLNVVVRTDDAVDKADVFVTVGDLCVLFMQTTLIL